MEMLGWAATILFGLCYWPQLYRSYKRKSVGDISFWSWFLQLIAYLFGIGYGFKLKQLPLEIGYLHGLFCTVLLLIMYFEYREDGE